MPRRRLEGEKLLWQRPGLCTWRFCYFFDYPLYVETVVTFDTPVEWTSCSPETGKVVCRTKPVKSHRTTTRRSAVLNRPDSGSFLYPRMQQIVTIYSSIYCDPLGSMPYCRWELRSLRQAACSQHVEWRGCKLPKPDRKSASRMFMVHVVEYLVRRKFRSRSV